ncbi:3-hydroxyacyl-ACP dehydratase FabZ family protein [Rhodopirellula sp. MGV]|uniref:3-hydroxyacyl-ACP dehydratase FabZ family protein n=1 Tax=Rhodopirellula sp. MGV TaxID=2023130 RepID=UPI000B97968A|nr:3-hydroxyacyl-ACP dehydratase FabZ family protein [Rhodopirellula sp. MGV]OYP39096.1 beta-hydroxyacyl-ACP dehydratase [Rhodopirellula sp. MGV]PNY35527.1 beta-hydroxyacyl-ACP dehydratase [Rhodopirellula baltica]
MRWFWVDRFTEFVSGSHAAGIKNVCLDAEVVDEYCPGYPMLPPTLIIEGMAQLGGIMVAEAFEFDKRVVLAKVGKAKFLRPALNGDTLQYHVQLDALQDNGGTVTCTSHCDGELQAEIELMFAFLEDGTIVEGPLYDPDDLKAMLQIMKFFVVAIDKDGNRFPKYAKLESED